MFHCCLFIRLSLYKVISSIPKSIRSVATMKVLGSIGFCLFFAALVSVVVLHFTFS